MEQPCSTSKVTVEYFDPYGLYKLIAPGLVSRLPLRHLHWQSHSGPLRSIDTLHVELVAAGSPLRPQSSTQDKTGKHTSNLASKSTAVDDGFQTATFGGRGVSVEDDVAAAAVTSQAPTAKERRHQIPGLRQTPYLKVLLMRCDSNDSYKSQTRSEIREWIKQHTAQAGKKSSVAENHDAFEWMIVHVVIPNSAAYTQPRTSKQSDGSATDLTTKSSSRWGKSSTTILEKLRSDFNSSSGSKIMDRVAQIRIGVNDFPFELLPLVVSAVPGGHAETEKESQNAWLDLIDKFKALILSSFDARVSQYEEDIREKDLQRMLPGWNFCTFFILKEGLARGFESVGLVEDALVGYDELSVGLDAVIKEQETNVRTADVHGGSLLKYTEDLLKLAQGQASATTVRRGSESVDEEPVDLQSNDDGILSDNEADQVDDIPISSTKKAYRELILANNVSVFDFRCYIFSRQISLLLRLGNAWSTREELLMRLRSQQDSVLPTATPHTARSKSPDESENLAMLAEICRRALEFIPALSQVMREDLLYAISPTTTGASSAGSVPDATTALQTLSIEVVDNMVASYAFSIAQQILAQTASKSLPTPPSTLGTSNDEAVATNPEAQRDVHPVRLSSLHTNSYGITRGPPSPGVFPGPGLPKDPNPDEGPHFLKIGLEELAARRADLFMLSRGILEERGKKVGWADGWVSAPAIGETSVGVLEDIDLHDTRGNDASGDGDAACVELQVARDESSSKPTALAGIVNALLRTALNSQDSFYRLYETLTDKALRHYTVAGNAHSVHANLADLAVLKYHLGDFPSAASYFYETTPFFGGSSWNLLELSMLVMYSCCLKEMGRKDEYAWRLLKLLSKAAEAERDRIAQQASISPGGIQGSKFIDIALLQGYLPELLSASCELKKEMRVPLTNFFNIFEVVGAPAYTEKQDNFALVLQYHSLLPDALPVDHVRVRMLCASSSGQPRDIWLETKEPLRLQPGNGTFRIYSNTVTPGMYVIDQVRLASSNVVIAHERQPANADASIFKEPHVIVYQRTSAFDVQLNTSKALQLDRNNHLEVELLAGWNEITQCELHIRAATGGLRLITSESQVVGSQHSFFSPAKGGVVTFGSIGAGTSAKITFPFSIEQDVLDLCVKIDVSYTTEHGVFKLSKCPSVTTALALGVNVQDVFKHNFLFSRFTVSTATASPLRLLRSELLDSDLFSSEFGTSPEVPPIVFPKQPASLLYRITRKVSSAASKNLKKSMQIKLHYSIIQDEIDEQLEYSLTEAFRGTDASIYEFSRVAVSCVLQHMHSFLSPSDLERIVLLGELSTSFIGGVDWDLKFPGLGSDSAGVDLKEQLSSTIRGWQAMTPVIFLSQKSALRKARTILIPVDIPSVTIVHTADIRLKQPLASSLVTRHNSEIVASLSRLATPMFCVNQLLPATLHLKWTRSWDTADIGAQPSGKTESQASEDLEFSFEVTAPTDTWLIGGRRKGHFIIPASNHTRGIGLTSTPESEAAIPLTLIPLREGWLPYPSVEIREVHSSDASGVYTGTGQRGPSEASHDPLQNRHHCETDYRNLGETVHIVADRKRVTLSLDASGPGGGPLVLESERPGIVSRLAV
ncbi:tmem1 family [Grosmannia clavigera kw1407]|uniref:Tmem1 family n=1 Tax=Grosmannia clavigera (strain kw1407 / UAMH 11150) TaxID=655863 RepID=F0XR01_GROCL|nr:tmem1 family [Grosmannia clavigera kw1407]EFW99686.1 tmem1 family [Grosmannia clavigera kw1407]